jgi:hypothetical protein
MSREPQSKRNREETHRYFCPECDKVFPVPVIYETDTGAVRPVSDPMTKCPACHTRGVKNL